MQGTVQTGDWLSQYSDEPDKVREFCVRHGILEHLRTAVELAHRSFPPIEKMSLSMWKDPVEKTEAVRLSFAVRSGVEEASAGDWRFLSQWTQAVPLPERDWILITYTTA